MRALTGAILFALCAAATAAEPRVVARVFDRTITLEEISPPAEIQGVVRPKKSEAEFAQWLREARVRAFQRLAWEEAVRRRLADFELEPTEAEVESLKSMLRAHADRRLSEWEGERIEVAERLSRGDLPEGERGRLEKRLDQLDELISHERETRARRAGDPRFEAQVQEAADQSARATVRRWKESKALYEAFGGRVVYQQAGYEPIGAYRALIAELDEAGAVEVLDPAFPDPLAELRAYLELRFITVPEEEAERYFAQPWWLQEE